MKYIFIVLSQIMIDKVDAVNPFQPLWDLANRIVFGKNAEEPNEHELIAHNNKGNIIKIHSQRINLHANSGVLV